MIGPVLNREFVIESGTFCNAKPIVQIPKQLINNLFKTSLKTAIKKLLLMGSLMLISNLF
jgi:hypothetical protein